jgi:hypothetical protein
MSSAVDRRRMAFELTEQMRPALDGIASRAVEIMWADGIDIVDGVSVGVRAGKMAEAMARANTARRVRDLDGYRRSLREAAAYVVCALLEIGEPVRLQAGTDPWTVQRSAPKLSETASYREIVESKLREREIEAAEAMRHVRLGAGTGDEIEYDVKNCPIQLDGYPDVVCDKWMGHLGPCHPLQTTVQPEGGR